MTGQKSPPLVIVPTYNERDSIAEVLRRVLEASPEAHVLVVDDASPDGTAALVRDIAREAERVHLLGRAAKTGLGDAYVAGFRWAIERDYSAVVEMDADLSHDPAAVPALVDALGQADLAIGSRYVDGGRIENWGRFRRALSRFGNLYAAWWLGHGVSDSTSGFRAFRTETLRAQDLQSVASHGYAFQIEMTYRVFQDGGRIAEVPITFVERVAGHSKMSRRIVGEALLHVTAWGLQRRLRRIR